MDKSEWTKTLDEKAAFSRSEQGENIRNVLDLCQGRLANITGARIGDVSEETIAHLNEATQHLNAALKAITEANATMPKRKATWW